MHSDIKLVSTDLITRRKRISNESEHLLSEGFIIKVQGTPKGYFSKIFKHKYQRQNLKRSKDRRILHYQNNLIVLFQDIV